MGTTITASSPGSCLSSSLRLVELCTSEDNNVSASICDSVVPFSSVKLGGGVTEIVVATSSEPTVSCVVADDEEEEEVLSIDVKDSTGFIVPAVLV